MKTFVFGKGFDGNTYLKITIEDREYNFTFKTHEEACFAQEKWLQQFGKVKPKAVKP